MGESIPLPFYLIQRLHTGASLNFSGNSVFYVLSILISSYPGELGLGAEPGRELSVALLVFLPK